MMSVIFGILFLSTVCVNLSFAATSQGYFNDPRFPGKCTINDNTILSPGEVKNNPNGDCMSIICGEDSYAEFQSCGVYMPTDGCKIWDYVNKSLTYPLCCDMKCYS